MFDFAWTEVALIGVVALVAIGPKDLPVAIKTVANLIKKARKMAGEFQTHVDEMVKDANLSEVREQIGALRSLDIKGTIARAVDADGSISRTLNEDPLGMAASSKPAYAMPESTKPAEQVTSFGTATIAPQPAVATVHAEPEEPDGAPAFVPPAVAAPPVPPAFIPPSATRHVRPGSARAA